MSSNNEAKTLTETAREWTEELRRREAERYETLLRERLKERYPNPSPEQKRKIEARVQTLMERHDAHGASWSNVWPERRDRDAAIATVRGAVACAPCNPVSGFIARSIQKAPGADCSSRRETEGTTWGEGRAFA